MTKIAVLGANGQVGAELCLLLANHADVQLVPVCRNRAGSAFLRYHGIRCRHGLPADPVQAAALFGDCDVVVNAALGAGTPRQVRVIEESLIANCLQYSRPGARVIYFSTMMVHGSPLPGAWVRGKGSYAKAKLRSERLARALGKRHRKETYILRLGHVCGELQNIGREVRTRLQLGEVVLPSREGPSNTVYTCTVADAVLQIAAGKEKPGTYDLMCWPEWTWRDVYAYEAEQCGVPLQVITVDQVPPRFRPSALLRKPLAALLRLARGSAAVKDAALKLLALAPRRLNERAQTVWNCTRARAEIQALRPSRTPPDATTWIAMGSEFLTNLTPTRKLLTDPSFRIAPRNPQSAWPAELPLYTPGVDE